MTGPPPEPPATAPPSSGRLRSSLQSRLGIDSRTLAAFRIALGLVVLFDLLAFRLPGLGTFYTDGGLFPRSALAETAPTLARWSLHALSGALWFQALLLGCTGVAAVCLLVGYRPRLASVGVALLLASLHARNPFLVNGGDTILVSVLFLAAYLPLGTRWSIRSRQRTDGKTHLSVATAVLLLHVESIYAINAVLKLRSESWANGTAVQRIFQLEDFVSLLGPTLAEFPAVLTAINWAWVALLLASPLLVLATGRLRTVTVAAFVGAHLGMAATMRLGSFPFVMCTVLLLFLPASAWDAIDRRLAGSRLRSSLTSLVDRENATAPNSPLSARPRLRRGVRITLTVALVCFLVASVSWQAVSAELVETPSTEEDGMLETTSWGFFAPNPPDTYGWYVVAATRESGEPIDLVDGGSVGFDRPPNAMDRYPSTLWQRYGVKGRGSGETLSRPAAAYFCERGDGVESVTVHRVEQLVDADGPVGEPTPRKLASVTCS